MKKIFMSAAMLAFLAASCTNEELVQEPMMSGGQPFTLSAEHGMASRTVLDGNQTLWSEGDQIYVSSADGSVYGVLTLKKGAGSDKAEFFGYVSGDPSRLAYTIFPAPKSGNIIDLSNRDASNDELDAPMIATFNPSNMNSVEFKNETALIKQPISGLSGQTITLSGNGIGGQLKPMLKNGQWELVSTGGVDDEITIKGAIDGTLLIPIATSVNQEANAGNQASFESITLTCTISDPISGTSNGSTTYTVNVENGQATNTNVPSIDIEDDGSITIIWDGKTLVKPEDKDAANSKVLYEVSEAAELAWVLRNWNGGSTSHTRPTTIKLMKNIDFGGHEIYFDMTEVGGFHSITLDGNNHTIKNYKVAGVGTRAALFPQTSGITIQDLTIDGAVIGSEQTSSDLYSGALIAISTDNKTDGPYTTMIKNVTVQNSTINGVNKVGGLVGQANGIHVVSDTEVKNTTITGHGTDAGSLGGLYGYLQVEGESSFSNSKMTNGAIICEDGEDKASRGSSGFIGTLNMGNANSSLVLTGCSVDGANLDKSNTTNPLNVLVGAIRGGTKAKLTIDGEDIDYSN